MNDCPNAEIRDQLPDLVHERLDSIARSLVLAHIDDCVDCRDEVQLLRDVRMAVDRRVPRVDVASIVGALPKAPVRSATVSRPVARRSAWSDWRIAAAATLVIAGGGSFALMHSESRTAPVQDSVVASAQAPVPSVNTPVGTQPTSSAPAARSSQGALLADDDNTTADMGGGNRLGDLTEEQLRTLLNDIEQLKPVPVTEPDPVNIRVDAKLSSEGV